jgi:D-glycero-alpha-D-manno-heptose-7-phosphate kinase
MEYQSVLTLAPVRISFLGGGTDIKSYYSLSPGKSIVASINKYVYVHIKKHDSLFQEKYRISYSKIEYANSREEIKNGIVRSCLELLDIDEPLQIATSSDLPASSGLGSSSSFTVALLLALHTLKGEEINRLQLAEEAVKVEIEMLRQPIGKQDQFSAVFGGINLFEFHNDESVQINPIELLTMNEKNFFLNSLLVWTGQTRDASSILADQLSNSATNFENLKSLVQLVEIFDSELRKRKLDLVQLGRLIKEGWELKQNFSRLINTLETRKICNELESAGALGYKVLGAGGGGFVYGLFEKQGSNIPQFANGLGSFVPGVDKTGVRVASII